MKYNVEKIVAEAKPRGAEAIQKAAWRKENASWLQMSRDIVLAIHYYMRKKGLTQSEVASRLGVSQANVAALLNGKANMTLKSLCDLQDALGVAVVSVSRPYEAATV